MADKLVISVYASHNAAIAMYYAGKYYVVEIERWLNRKNSGIIGYLELKYPQTVFDEVMDYLLGIAGTRKIDTLLVNYLPTKKMDLTKYEIGQIITYDHHNAHAACALYQSDFNNSLIFTYDGGGNGSFFNVYLADSRSDGPKLIERLNLDLGFPYMILADHLADIRKDPLNIGNLVYAGKLMGLCGYGEVNEEWIPHFEKFYKCFQYNGNAYIGGAEVRVKAINGLMKDIGLDGGFDIESTRFSDKISWDIAATSQQAFENIFFELAGPFLEKYADYPVGLSGGCALNVILNSKILKSLSHNNIFVPPNTNDCGIAVGGLLEYMHPDEQIDLTYSGIPIMDERDESILVENECVLKMNDVTIKEISTLLANDYIVGIVRGNCEHGPRALGNRSILCNPVGDMKDTLNAKVKDREWYRPFAPIVRYEDVSKYFDFEIESRHMTFVAEVRKEHDFPAITHIDGTGRLQTVKREQNEFIYDVITEFERQAGHGVLLNTSFNVNGRPILSRLSDAMEILTKTELDCFYYEGSLYFRNTRMKEFTDILRPKIVSTDVNDPAIYLLAYTDDDNKFFNSILPSLLEINKSNKNVINIINRRHHRHIAKELKNAVIEDIDGGNMYYRELVESAGMAHNHVELIKHLWVKDILMENKLKRDFHVFVDLNVDNAYNKFIEMTKYVKNNSLGNNVLLFETDEPISDKISNRIKASRRIKANVENYIYLGCYAGFTDIAIEFLLGYEGNFRWQILQGWGERDKDFVLLHYAEKGHDYKVVGV